VIHSLGRAATVLALCLLVGLQWLALQSVAWTTMLINNAKCAPLRTAIAHTFDGAHPCSLCHVVNQGKNSEKKSDVQSPGSKIDIICVARSIQLLPHFVPFDYGTINFSFSEAGHSPPIPPPRFFIG
jgi:hypothetical protein